MTSRRRISPRDHRGFTLVEMVVALLLTVIVGAAFYRLYLHQRRQYLAQQNTAELQQNARFVIDTINRDLVMTGYLPNLGAEPNAGPAIVEAQDGSLTITYWDEKAQTTATYDKHYRITYRIDSTLDHTPVVREVTRYNPDTDAWDFPNTTAYRVGEFADTLAFEYYDEGNNLISPAPGTDPAKLELVRSIKVRAKVRSYETDPFIAPGGVPAYRYMTLERTVKPRNLFIAEKPTDTTAPLKPQNVEAIDPGVCGRMEVRWTANTERDLRGYYLFLGQEEGLYSRKVRLGPTISSYAFTDLIPAKQADPSPVMYHVAVAAFDKSGNQSPLSDEAWGNPPTSTRTFGAGPNDTTLNPDKPLPPTSFDAADGPSDGVVSLSWVASASPGVVEYRLFRSTTAGATPVGTTAGQGNCVAVLNVSPEGAHPTTYADTGLVGCTVYYYQICAVNCDDTLVPIYAATDYVHCYGDGPGALIADDVPRAGVSDSAPPDGAQPPDPTLTSLPGWRRVFLSLTNTTLAETPDFTRTEIWWATGNTPPGLVKPGCQVSDGRLLPDNGGVFTQPGSGGPNSPTFDSTTEENPAAGPQLANNATYSFLAVTYDRCGNCSDVTTASTTLSELCGDDPLGLPQCSPPVKLTTVAEGCGSDLRLSWNGDCLKDFKPNNPYVQDFAGFEIFRNEGEEFGGGTTAPVNLSGGTPQWGQTFVDSTAVEGKVYSYGVKWMDCAWANDNGGNISDPAVNGGAINGLSLGRVIRDSDDLVTSGDLTVCPPVYTHNGVTFHVRNSSGKPLQITSLRFMWDSASARLGEVVVGDGATTPRESVWTGSAVTGSVLTLTGKSLNAGDEDIPVQLIFAGATGGTADMREETITYEIAYRNQSTGSNCATTGTFTVPTGPVISSANQDKPFMPTTSWAVPGYEGTSRRDLIVVPGLTPVTVFAEIQFPGLTTLLRESVSASATVIPVLSTNGFPNAGTITIGSEKITYSGRTSFPNPEALTNCVRGTGATAYVAGATVFLVSGGEEVTLYYYRDTTKLLTSPPPFDASCTNWTALPMRRVSGTLWRLYSSDPVDLGRDYRIPSSDDASVWYFIVARDSRGNFDRDPEVEAGAYQYYQERADICNNIPGAPTLDGQVVGDSVVLTWTPPPYNTNGSPCVDLAGFKIYRHDGFTDTYLTDVPGGTSVTFTDHPPDVSTRRWSYYVTAYDQCAPVANEGLASRRYFECSGEYPCAVNITRKQADPNAGFVPGDSFDFTVDICGNTETSLWAQTCSERALRGPDADPIKLTNDGWGLFSIDGSQHSSDPSNPDMVRTWGESAYPSPFGSLDLWVNESPDVAGVYDIIRVNAYYPALTADLDATCAPTAVCQGTITVSLNAADAPLIGWTPEMFNLTAPENNASTPASLQVWNAGQKALAYTISVDAPWLTVSPASGTSTGGRTSHLLNLSPLQAGFYAANITITDIQAANSPVTIPVRLAVAGNSPAIGVSPTTVTASTPQGGSPREQTITLTNTGGGTLDYLISENATWLAVSPASGSLPADGSQVVALTFTTSTLLDGTYTATVTIRDPEASNNPVTIPVTLTINKDPCVNPLAPATPTGLTGTASSPDGNTDKITLRWTPPSPGPGLGPISQYYIYECSGSPTCVPETRVATVTAPASQHLLTTSTGSGANRKLWNNVFRWAISAVNAECSINPRPSPPSEIFTENYQ